MGSVIVNLRIIITRNHVIHCFWIDLTCKELEFMRFAVRFFAWSNAATYHEFIFFESVLQNLGFFRHSFYAFLLFREELEIDIDIC